MVHVVNKGKEGEREAIKFLQPHINECCEMAGVEPIQLFRNQNQSALGGYDIDGLSWLALEIKRQEALSIPAWWRQVTKAAREGQEPVVMFRQNRKPWRFLVRCYLYTGGTSYQTAMCEVSKEAFIDWFRARLSSELHKAKSDI